MFLLKVDTKTGQLMFAYKAASEFRADNDNSRPPPVDLWFLSPCPEGYDTVLGYFAKHDPVVLDLLDRDPEVTKRDGYWLVHRCREYGLEVIKVDACPWLQKHGVLKVNAYPEKILALRIPAV